MSSSLFTQVHCVKNERILLMHRNKNPNLGLSVAPGGKVENNESPFECAIRELREETGLSVLKMSFRGMVTLIIPTIQQPLMHFLYLVTEFNGELKADEREGTLKWWSIDEIEMLSLPQANQLFLPHVLNQSQPLYQAKYVYDNEERLVDVIEHDEYVDSNGIEIA